MKNKSQLKEIKSIHKWGFSLELFEDQKGIYHVVADNTISGTKRTVSLIDFNMANFAFETQLNSFEGN